MNGPRDRSVAYLRARIERIERRMEAINNGGLDGIIDSDDRNSVLSSYRRELEMYRYMLGAVMLKVVEALLR